VPLITHHQTIGVIWIGKEGEITANDLRVLTAIGDISASAIQRAALFEQTQLRLQRLIGLHSIDMAITASLDARVTMSMLLDQVTTQLQMDAADVLLLHPDLQTLEYAGGRGLNTGRFHTLSLHLGEGLAGQVAVDRRPVHIPDLLNAEDQPAAQNIRESGEGFKAYFAVPLIAKGQVKGVLEVFNRSSVFPESEWFDFLETLATQAAIAVDNADLFNRLQRSNDELSLAYDATIEGWSHALELRDHETQGHSHRVTDLSLNLARKMNYSGRELSQFRRGVLLHDIGKMGIPDNILLKPGPLTQEEWEIMRRHPNYAYDMLSPIPYLRNSLDVPYSHHERWNGSGYPRGLKAEQIPISARIFAVVDVWDALTSDRPYRKAWPETKVRDYICSRAGVDFDPSVVEAFVRMKFGEKPNGSDGSCPD
jgi:HD-GYP domain-containing protein (c-di-GMP phosphodiesterase class II)